MNDPVYRVSLPGCTTYKRGEWGGGSPFEVWLCGRTHLLCSVLENCIVCVVKLHKSQLTWNNITLPNQRFCVSPAITECLYIWISECPNYKMCYLKCATVPACLVLYNTLNTLCCKATNYPFWIRMNCAEKISNHNTNPCFCVCHSVQGQLWKEGFKGNRLITWTW